MGQPDAAVGERAEGAGGEQLVDRERDAVVQPRQVDDERGAGGVGRGDQRLAVRDGRREQLLGEDVPPGGERRADHVAVGARRGRHRHGVDVVAGEQRAEVAGELDPVPVGARAAALGVVVPDGDELRLRMRRREVRVVRGVDVPEAEDRDADRPARYAPWHFLYFLPDPHQHGSLRPSCSCSSTRRCSTTVGAACGSSASTP